MWRWCDIFSKLERKQNITETASSGKNNKISAKGKLSGNYYHVLEFLTSKNYIFIKCLIPSMTEFQEKFDQKGMRQAW